MRRVVTLILFVSIVSMAAGSLSCSSGDGSGKREPLTIGSSHNEADTLLYIAQEKGYFRKNGLDVTIRDYTSGAAAVEGMLKGEVDIATSSEFVIVQNAFRKQPIRTIGTISENYSTSLVARVDRGIGSIADLDGKKIAIPGQTLAQFQLGRFLDLNTMSGKPMSRVNIDITQSVDTLVNGDVDAALTWEPYVSRIKKVMGERVVVWPVHNGQPQYKNVTAPDTWLAQRPEVVKRVVKSLAQAESFAALHPDHARDIVKNALQYDDEYINSVWPLNQFSLSLNQALIVAMEDEARWMMKNNLTDEKQVPDFLPNIYEDGLKAVKPRAVNIFRR